MELACVGRYIGPPKPLCEARGKQEETVRYLSEIFDKQTTERTRHVDVPLSLPLVGNLHTEIADRLVGKQTVFRIEAHREAGALEGQRSVDALGQDCTLEPTVVPAEVDHHQARIGLDGGAADQTRQHGTS